MQIKKLLIMSILHFASMYVLMYSMVNDPSGIYINLNNTYMAEIMTAPMLIFESILMSSMYKDKNILKAIGAIGTGILIFGFLFIRRQTFIDDRRFIRSMIPHHSGAILMCEQSHIDDQQLRELCSQIISSQQSEIDQMEAILSRLN